MKYDPAKHHRRSIRLPGYDYTAAGAYFMTICTHHRECLLGEIVAGVMQLNRSGQLVHIQCHTTIRIGRGIRVEWEGRSQPSFAECRAPTAATGRGVGRDDRKSRNHVLCLNLLAKSCKLQYFCISQLKILIS